MKKRAVTAKDDQNVHVRRDIVNDRLNRPPGKPFQNIRANPAGIREIFL